MQGIGLGPSSPVPLPRQGVGVPARGQPLFLSGVAHPEERDSGKQHGALGLPGPLRSQQSEDIQERFLVFISVVSGQLLRETLSHVSLARPLAPAS